MRDNDRQVVPVIGRILLLRPLKTLMLHESFSSKRKTGAWSNKPEPSTRPACGMAVPAFKIFDTNRILRETSVSQLVGYCGSGLVKPPAGIEHIFTRSAPKKIQRPALESRPQEHHLKFTKRNLARSRARERCTHAHALHPMFTNALLAHTPADRTKVNIGANVCDQATRLHP